MKNNNQSDLEFKLNTFVIDWIGIMNEVFRNKHIDLNCQGHEQNLI